MDRAGFHPHGKLRPGSGTEKWLSGNERYRSRAFRRRDFLSWTGNTFALVEAKGAEGAEIPGYAGTRVNRAGYALVPNLMPYQKNSVSIDPTSVEDDPDLDSTSQQVIPYAGAVVKVKYRAAEGVPVLVTVRRSNGEGVPFSARAIDASNKTVGYVGQGAPVCPSGAAKRGSETSLGG